MDHSHEDEASNLKKFKPLLLIFLYLSGGSFLASSAMGDLSPHTFMGFFMAGFFLVFSFFKFLDLESFAATFRRYDPIAKLLPGYAFVYPGIEALLGALYLARVNHPALHGVVLFITAANAFGVFQSLAKKEGIQCACLGAVIDLPLTKVTLIEDLSMAAMAIAMLAIR